MTSITIETIARDFQVPVLMDFWAAAPSGFSVAFIGVLSCTDAIIITAIEARIPMTTMVLIELIAYDIFVV